MPQLMSAGIGIGQRAMQGAGPEIQRLMNDFVTEVKKRQAQPK
jgi:hypothetical protein